MSNFKSTTVSKRRKQSRGTWTAHEDEALRKAVEQHSGKNWKKIAEHVPGRTDVQCLHRWQKVLNPTLVKGPWTEEEDNKVRELVKIHGPKKWSTIAAHLPGRIGKQCRERWTNHLDPLIKKGSWEPWEDQLIITLQRDIGNKWAKIAKNLPGRTDNAVKNRFNSTISRKLRQQITTDDQETKSHEPELVKKATINKKNPITKQSSFKYTRKKKVMISDSSESSFEDEDYCPDEELSLEECKESNKIQEIEEEMSISDHEQSSNDDHVLQTPESVTTPQSECSPTKISPINIPSPRIFPVNAEFLFSETPFQSHVSPSHSIVSKLRSSPNATSAFTPPRSTPSILRKRKTPPTSPLDAKRPKYCSPGSHENFHTLLSQTRRQLDSEFQEVANIKSHIDAAPSTLCGLQEAETGINSSFIVYNYKPREIEFQKRALDKGQATMHKIHDFVSNPLADRIQEYIVFKPQDDRAVLSNFHNIQPPTKVDG